MICRKLELSKYKRKGISVVALLLVAGLATAQGQASEQVNIPRLKRAPGLRDFEHMQPQTDIAMAMVKIDRLVQRTPTDGSPVSQRTEVYLGYDESSIYAVYLCFDSEPKKIRARLVNREGIAGDDFVSLQLDTFHDQRRAYVFAANAYGVQFDAVWVEGQGFDSSFDTVWYSKGELTDKGYTVWIRVPFKSLRFKRAQEQAWGILVTRDIPRNSEESFWPRYSSRVQGRLNQIGVARGLTEVSPGRTLQFIPYGILGTSRALDERDPSHARFSTRALEGRLGLDTKIVFKDSLVLDLTLNPDFSQIESDEPQISANQRFELFFPERRPFFIENANYFTTPIQLLFTRRIADPRMGARLTGKIGPFSVGALVADDESPGRQVPPNDSVAGKRATFGVLRLNRELPRQSSIGAIFTSRVFAGSTNLVAGIDGRTTFHKNWSAATQLARSVTSAPGSARRVGTAYDLSLRRQGYHFNLDFAYRDRSAGFHTDSGFVPRVNLRQVETALDYVVHPTPGGRLVNWGPVLSFEGNWDHSGVLSELFVRPALRWNWIRQTSLTIYPTIGVEQAKPVDFPILKRNSLHSVRDVTCIFETNLLDWMSARGEFSFLATGTNFVPAAGTEPGLEDRQSGSFGLTFRPHKGLTIENTYLETRLKRHSDGANIFNDHILRSRWNYQFTPSLSIRAIAQYDALLTNPTFTSLRGSKSGGFDFLFTYLVHPGTAVFVGYNTNLQNIDRRLIPADGDLRRTRSSFLNDRRQFFVKVSYLFRF